MPYNSKLPIALQTDASDFALGAILTHILKADDKLIEKPVCYESKTLSPIQENYSTTEKECSAVVKATKLFQLMMIGKR